MKVQRKVNERVIVQNVDPREASRLLKAGWEIVEEKKKPGRKAKVKKDAD